MNEDSTPTEAEMEREAHRVAAETLRTLAANFTDQRKATACALGARALERQMEEKP